MQLLKWFVRMILKLVLLPIIIIMGILWIVIKIFINIYGFVGVFFWGLIIFALCYTAVNNQWEQTFLFGIMGCTTFLVLFVAVWAQVMLEDGIMYLSKV